MSRFVKVAAASEIPENEGRSFVVENQRIAVFNAAGTFYALEDRCSHEEAPIGDGYIDGDEVECPWHGACFSLKTGQCTAPPGDGDLTTFVIRVIDGDVEVELKE